MSRILARGSLEMPPIRLDMMVVVAVREWLLKLLVTYGSREFDIPCCMVSTKAIIQILIRARYELNRYIQGNERLGINIQHICGY